MENQMNFTGKKAEDEDRISSLPDSILHHILSFAPTVYALHTCLFSKRWRYIWTGIPKLVFDERAPIFSDKINFLNFAETMIRVHGQTYINEFYLFVMSNNPRSDDAAPRIEALLSTVLRKHIQKFEVCINPASPIMFPSRLFACASLVSLKFDASRSCVRLPASVSFPNLELLHLQGVKIELLHHCQVSFSCPGLKNLMLIDCHYEFAATITIFAPELETLQLIDAVMAKVENGLKLKIYAQNILTLTVMDRMSHVLTIHNILPLPNACIDIQSGTVPDLVSKLLQSISNVKELIAFLFGFLTVESLLEFLCSLSNIDSLIITNCLHATWYHNYDWALAAVPQSFLSQLKSFEIRGFDGTELELSLVDFVLKNARSIEKMSIISSCSLSENPQKQIEVMKRLSHLPKASIVFS